MLVVRKWCCGGNSSSARIQNQHQAQSQQVTPSGRQVGDSNERTVSFSAQLASSMTGRNRAPNRQQTDDEDAPMDETPLLCMSPLNHACTSAGAGTDKEDIQRQGHWGDMLLRHHKLVNMVKIGIVLTKNFNI